MLHNEMLNFDSFYWIIIGLHLLFSIVNYKVIVKLWKHFVMLYLKTYLN